VVDLVQVLRLGRVARALLQLVEQVELAVST
jgi:hypothetical protein